jgi:hypothetical protein
MISSQFVCGESNIMLFADDAKLYSRVDINKPTTSLGQQSLNRLSSWSENWQLAMNSFKCYVLSTYSGKV